MMYVIVARQLGFMKVGVSRNPLSRLKNLQTAFPSPLEILFIVPSGCEQDEVKFHTALSRFRIQGEWFEMTSEAMGKIDELLSGYEFLDAVGFASFDPSTLPPPAPLIPKPSPVEKPGALPIPPPIEFTDAEYDALAEIWSREMREVFPRADLTATARLVWAEMWHLAVFHGHFDPANSQLAETLGYSSRSIRAARQILTSVKLIPINAPCLSSG